MSMIQLQAFRDELLERMAAALNPLSEELDKYEKVPAKLEKAVDELYEIYDYIETQTTPESKERYFRVYCELFSQGKNAGSSSVMMVTDGCYINESTIIAMTKQQHPLITGVQIAVVQELTKEDYEDYTREGEEQE